MKKGFGAAGCLLLLSFNLIGAEERMMRANITGGGGDGGKCTIEVNVDDVAIVQISGDQGRLITVAGQPAEWRRMQCTGPLPRNPSDFRFSGVDGRGRQTLVRDPRNNRGVAEVRIEDPKGGREGYTFDIEWRGGDNRTMDHRDDDRHYGGRPEERFTTVTCSSDDGRRRYCEVDTRAGVTLLKQRSGSPCDLNRTWGFDRRGIWVDRGCRADFQVRVP